MIKTLKTSKTLLETPLGPVEISGNEKGISQIRFTDKGEATSEEIPRELIEATTQLNNYFSGKLKNFDVKLNPAGTAFQQKVWKALMNIPYGTTTSYLELSKSLGDEKAVRAVAAANGKNPLWIIIPCHRVIGSDGSLTGYAGGIYRKKWLLNHENPSPQQSLF